MGRWTTRRYCQGRKRAFEVADRLYKENPDSEYRVWNLIQRKEEFSIDGPCGGCPLCDRYEKRRSM